MRSPLQLALAALVTLLVAHITCAEDAAPKKILFIGNSYTAGSKSGIEYFFQQAGGNVKLQFITPGGKRLSDHATNAKTIRTIHEGDWNLVVLQEQSQLPSLPAMQAEFEKAGEHLVEEIAKSDSKSLLFLTWGRRDGDQANRQLNPDFVTMQSRLTDAYTTLSEKSKTPIAPVGAAWAIVNERSPELFNKLYASDGSHPSRFGAYLSGAVIYAAITGDDPRRVDAPIRGISKAEAEALRSAAHDAVNP